MRVGCDEIEKGVEGEGSRRQWKAKGEKTDFHQNRGKKSLREARVSNLHHFKGTYRLVVNRNRIEGMININNK